ncbi:hypothetical protein WJX74_006754 [Apatococcus lobatus]|uniref:AB hydrolase-1 domain-containing protein n=2 Tax=Apatococcus TaxID=904362 RepID=A0AAW1RRI9_9CHLO
MQRVRCLGGLKLAVHFFGGSGDPLIVCPANGFPVCSYLPLVAHLKESFTCYGIDLRGYGDSPSGVGPDSLYFGSDVACVVKALGLQGALAFGHSVGGAALLLAQIVQPGTFSRIVCYEPILYDRATVEASGDDSLVKRGSRILAAGAKRRRRAFSSRKEAGIKYSARPPFDRFAPAALESYLTHGFRDVPGGIELKCDPVNESEAYLKSIDVMPILWPGCCGIQCPVAMLAGSDISDQNSTEFIAHYIEDTLTLFQKARFERLEGLHHLGPFEDPQRVATAIAAHLQDMSRFTSLKSVKQQSKL